MGSDTPRILVVDDNPATLYSTSRILRGGGSAVTEAETGREAYSLAPGEGRPRRPRRQPAGH